MLAAYDLNHSKYTVQKITNEWKKKNLNNNTKLRQTDRQTSDVRRASSLNTPTMGVAA